MAEAPIATQGDGIAGAQECPICLRSMAKPRKCKTLYGVTVCNKCRNGFANRRQAAYIVDCLLYFVLAQTLLVFLVRQLAASAPAQYGPSPADIIGLLLSWVVFPFGFTLKDAFGGRSPGKMLCGVRVVDAVTREPIAPARSIKRNLILLIPYVGAIGGAITMMGGQRWGDRWANTMVIWNKYAFRQPFSLGGRYCRGCGYDLTGNVSGRCPECGMTISTPVPLPIPAAVLPG